MEFNAIRDVSGLIDVYKRNQQHMRKVFYNEEINLEKFVDIFRGESWLYEIRTGDLTGYCFLYEVAPGAMKFGVIGVDGFKPRHGRDFMAELCARLRRRCCNCVIAEAPAASHGILSLARRLGWRRSGRIENYFGPGADMIILTIKL